MSAENDVMVAILNKPSSYGLREKLQAQVYRVLVSDRPDICPSTA